MTNSVDKIKEAYDLYSNEMHKDYGTNLHRFYEGSIKKILDKNIPDHSNVLDLGCGQGFPSLYIHKEKNCDIIVSDISSSMLNKLKNKISMKQNFNMLSFDIYSPSFPLKDDSFDVVTAISSLCYTDDLKNMYSEVSRTLKKDGLFIPTFIQKNFLHMFRTMEKLC